MKRKYATKIKNLHRYRVLMPYLMPTRNESVVYYDSYARADKLLEFLESVKDSPEKISLTHLLVWICGIGLHNCPTMNRFVSGRTLYQNEKSFVSFSIKKEKAFKSPVKVIKMEIEPDETLEQVARRVNERLNVARSDKKTYTDKEIDLVTCIPGFILRFLMGLVRWLDYYNLLPYWFVKNDPLYAGVFIANLGSIGMDAAFHHLYEYGTISLFLTVGMIKEMPVVEDGQVVVRKMIQVRFSYDERIDDGMTSREGINAVMKVLENPFEHVKVR